MHQTILWYKRYTVSNSFIVSIVPLITMILIARNGITDAITSGRTTHPRLT